MESCASPSRIRTGLGGLTYSLGEFGTIDALTHYRATLLEGERLEGEIGIPLEALHLVGIVVRDCTAHATVLRGGVRSRRIDAVVIHITIHAIEVGAAIPALLGDAVPPIIGGHLGALSVVDCVGHSHCGATGTTHQTDVAGTRLARVRRTINTHLGCGVVRERGAKILTDRRSNVGTIQRQSTALIVGIVAGLIEGAVILSIYMCCVLMWRSSCNPDRACWRPGNHIVAQRRNTNSKST